MANPVLSHVSPARLHNSNWSCNFCLLGANLAMGGIRDPPPPSLLLFGANNLTSLENCSYWLENGWRDINEPIFQWVIYLDFKSCPGNILGRGYPPFTLYINTIFKPKKIYHHTNETAGERKEGLAWVTRA